MSTNARLHGITSQYFLCGELRRKHVDLLDTQALGDITYPGKQEQRESMSCCRLLDDGQHTLPEREVKAATAMMMMLMMGKTNLFA